jgi:Predicted dehydrogenases and related proteins
MAVQALKAGKNVICEKPMASDLNGAKEMVKAWKDTGKMLTIFHNRRLDLDFQLVMKTIKSGKLGKVFKINRNILEYSKRSDWQIWKGKGGGHLNNWGTHLIDQMLYLTGKTPELQFSKLGRLTCEGDAEDYFHGIFRFDDGLVYELELSYASMLKLPEWIVWGDKGALMIDNSRVIIEYERDGEKFKEEEAIEQDNFSVWQGFYTNIYNHLKNKEALMVKPDEVSKVMELINEAKKGTDFC